jgi:hypothetical protein
MLRILTVRFQLSVLISISRATHAGERLVRQIGQAAASPPPVPFLIAGQRCPRALALDARRHRSRGFRSGSSADFAAMAISCELREIRALGVDYP